MFMEAHSFLLGLLEHACELWPLPSRGIQFKWEGNTHTNVHTQAVPNSSGSQCLQGGSDG